MNRAISIISILSLIVAPYTFAVPHAQAAVSLVQTNSGNGGGYVNSYTISFASNVTAGSVLLLCITLGTGTSTISDNRSNTWTLASTNLNERRSTLYYVQNANAGATTITVTFGSGQFEDSASVIREYSGLETTGVLDTTASSNSGASGATSHSSGATATTAQANELVIGCHGGATSADPTLAAGTGYGNLRWQQGFDNWTSGGMEDATVSATGAQTATFTSTQSYRSQTIVATFKETVAAAAAAVTPGDIIFFD